MKMNSETQAMRLARLVQRHIQSPKYELVLPSVMIQSKKLKKLSSGDLILTGFDRLDLLLMDGEKICANAQLKKRDMVYSTEIVKLPKDTEKQSDSKKYKNLKISFGKVQSKVLEIGQRIDITHLDLERVTLVSKGKRVAEGSLVSVDKEIAIEIKKVN